MHFVKAGGWSARNAGALVGFAMFFGTHGALGGLPVVYESFSYTLGANVSGQNGGSGWAGAWSDVNNSPEHGKVVAGLTFSNLDVSGNALALSYNGNAAPTFLQRQSSGLPIVQSGQKATVYASYLIQYAGGYSPTVGFGGAYASTQFGVKMGNPAVGATGAFLATSDSMTGSETSLAAKLSETLMVVTSMTCDFTSSPSHSQTAWVLTASQFANFKAGGLTEMELNTASVGAGATSVLGRAVAGPSNYSPTNFNYVGFNFGGTTSATTFDELRMGSTLDLVTPTTIPAPGACVLAALAMAATSRRRRS